MNHLNAFKRHRFVKETILTCVQWYLRYNLSYRNIEEMMQERGESIDHTTIYRWIQKYSPEIAKRALPFIKKNGNSYKVDETYIKVKGKWKYLYRAVDKQGNTLDFLFTYSRNAEQAKQLFIKLLGQPYNKPPRVINVDKNAAYPKAIKTLKQSGQLSEKCKLRTIKYLNNLIEADHRFIKRQVRHKQWFRSYSSAQKTINGYEIMHMIRKGQIKRIEKGDVLSQNRFIANLFNIAT